MPAPTLTTDRLILRPFTNQDLPALTVLHREPSFWWYPLRGAMPPEQTAEFLTRTMARYESDGVCIEAVVDRTSGLMIGWAGLAVPHFLPEILPAVEVGWRLSPTFRGLGLATEIGQAAVDWGFTEGGLDRLVSIFEPENAASGRVMEHLGFVPCLWTSGARGEEVTVTELSIDTWRERRTKRDG
ncbi:MAG TPA: GNAT family N-acetyltransferase [Acidimicrobiales bacterium]|jgi:RimJ/RimL family protein N-acetyltransferase